MEKRKELSPETEQKIEKQLKKLMDRHPGMGIQQILWMNIATVFVLITFISLFVALYLKFS